MSLAFNPTTKLVILFHLVYLVSNLNFVFSVSKKKSNFAANVMIEALFHLAKSKNDMTKLAQYLVPKDKIAICSCARKISKEDLFPAMEVLRNHGFEVILGNSIGAEANQFAGSDKERAEDLQQMIDNPEIKAVLFARGGYGAVRILDKVDFSSLETNPKWLIGYSDMTAVLSHIYFKHNVSGLHASMPVDLLSGDEGIECFEYMLECLKGNHKTFDCNSAMECSDMEFEGEMIGGNLSVLYSLLGSESFGETTNKILFLEDLDEYLYHIDRMMQALKRAGKLSNLKALVVGSFSQMHDNTIPFGQTAYEIIASCVEEYNYPKVFGVNIGHEKGKNIPIVIGKNTRIQIKNNIISIEQL